MTLSEELRRFNARLDLASLDAVLQALGVDRASVREQGQGGSFTIDSQFFGASGRLAYQSADEASSARLTFHAESGSCLRLSRAELFAAFPDARAIYARNSAPSGGVSVHGEGNSIHFVSDDIDAEELKITTVMFFPHPAPPVGNGLPLALDDIKAFHEAVDLRSPEDVLRRLGVDAHDVRWTGDVEAAKSFVASGRVFGGFTRLSYTLANSGAELILLAPASAPCVTKAALDAAYPQLEPSNAAAGTWLAREGRRIIIFTTAEGDANELLATSLIFIERNSDRADKQ